MATRLEDPEVPNCPRHCRESYDVLVGRTVGIGAGERSRADGRPGSATSQRGSGAAMLITPCP